MRRGYWLALLLLSLLVATLAAVWVREPGYMDAEYYFATGRELAAGQGFHEPFLWNYLDDPEGLPHPSHLYWMPLVSLLSAAAMTVGPDIFRVAQVPFVLMAAGIPLLTACMALRLGAKERQALLAGLLAIFSGFFLPFFVTTDAFSVYSLLGGGLLLILADARSRGDWWRWLLAGILAGLAHLARADGLFLLIPALVFLFPWQPKCWRNLLLLAAGYLVCIMPWMLRNLAVVGSLFPAGSAHTLCMLNYDELYSYPAALLTPQRWWNAGLGAALLVRGNAMLGNLATLLVVDGFVFLAPLILVGAYRLRRQTLVRPALAYLLALFLFMSLVFPFAGMRGGFFHSSAALLPLLWALAPIGLEQVVAWVSARRTWDARAALRIFEAGMVALAGLASVWLYWRAVIGPQPQLPRWERAFDTYRVAGSQLASLDCDIGLVAVNNPPGFFLATGLPAVVIPDGGEETLRQVSQRYAVEWIVLEANHPYGLDALYAEERLPAWMSLERQFEDADGRPVLLFHVAGEEGEE
jgi:4-amino-4-deoxy-L-arabinose transferase-like glycosyltransferase